MKKIHPLALTALALACCSAFAQDNAVLRAAAQKAITTNPEVTARYNAFLASKEEVGVASGAYYPRLDFGAEVGRTRDKITSRNPESQSLDRAQGSLTLTQMLWDGLSTRDEVSRLGHAKLTRYFEFLDASEQTALEATRAYADVQRYRRLVQLAEDNYVAHKTIELKMQAKSNAGATPGVDFEQASARLSLAESNLSTEQANLHDVLERYRRIVGDLPPADLPAANLSGNVPASVTNAVQDATTRSPSVVAAIENLRAVRDQASEVKGGAYQPRVEARVRGGVGHNFDGVQDQKREVAGEIVLNWNLFKGGSDQSRVRQFANLVNQAADQRDKACRDARQQAAIAYNDIGKLTDQIAYLKRNEASIRKARDGYRQQFDVSRRNLLDLLNSENELYTAQRALASAEYDLAIAQARTHAATGNLVTRLGLTKAGENGDAPDISKWSSDGDGAAGRCPAEATVLTGTPKEALDKRATDSLGPVTGKVAPPPVIDTTPKSPPEKKAPVTAEEFAQDRLDSWAAAWMAKDVDRYLGFYSKNFIASKKGGKQRWINDRRRLVGKKGPIELVISNIQTKELTPTKAEIVFDQAYKSIDYSDSMRKALTWERIGSDWFIVRESNR